MKTHEHKLSLVTLYCTAEELKIRRCHDHKKVTFQCQESRIIATRIALWTKFDGQDKCSRFSIKLKIYKSKMAFCISPSTESATYKFVLILQKFIANKIKL